MWAGCASQEPDHGPSVTQQLSKLSGAPPPLAEVHEQANELLGGGLPAFRARLDSLRGYAVVVNVWGSWCPPCRDEFPYFQRQAVTHGKRIAFLGVNSNGDATSDARDFLESVPVSFPSFKDPMNAIAGSILGTLAFPATVFYDAQGKRAYIHLGKYRSQQDLAEDIRRYAD